MQKLTGIMALIIAALLGVQVYQGSLRNAEPQWTTPYQAVQLIGGQVFFGKLSGANTAYPVLRDAYVINRQENATTHEVTNALMRINNSWNAPDRVIINARQIVLIQPVEPSSAIGKMIAAQPAP